MLDIKTPDVLQFKPTIPELDAKVAEAKAALLNSIKRSIYLYRVDCGGCNGCEIEIFATITSVFDAERFGIKNTPSPRHADVLIYTGAVTRAMYMPAMRAYAAAPDPKLVLSYGACGCTGGIFHDNYCVWGGTDKILPVDVYVPGCPPSPVQTIYGFAMVLGLLEQKLHESHNQETSFAAPPAFPDIPYKLRVSFEREARLMSGYYYGARIANEFMEALTSGAGDAISRADALIAAETDPRKADVFKDLKSLLESKIDMLK
jgi:Ni,Fe-hydrogenase III small subunit